MGCQIALAGEAARPCCGHSRRVLQRRCKTLMMLSERGFDMGLLSRFLGGLAKKKSQASACAACGRADVPLTPCRACQKVFCDSHGKHYAGMFACLECLKRSRRDWQSKATAVKPRDANQRPVGSAAPEGRAREGLALVSGGQFDAAITLFDEAIQMESKLAFAYAGRAIAKHAKADYSGANFDAATAVQHGLAGLTPSAPGDIQTLPRVEFKQNIGLWPEIHPMDNLANPSAGPLPIGAQPPSANSALPPQRKALAYACRGCGWFRSNFAIRAVYDFSEAADLAPAFAEAHLGLALAWLLSAERDKALASLESYDQLKSRKGSKG